MSPFSTGNYSKFTVVELATYSQTNGSGAFTTGPDAFVFEASIGLASNLTASAATVTIPNGGGPQAMIMTDPSHFAFGGPTNSFANLASAFPDGDYVFTISNHSTSVLLPQGTTIPNAPTVANYDAAQAIDATHDFTLSWAPFSGGGARDFISVEVSGQFGTVFKSGDFGCPDALDGTSTSVLIPANTLVSNQTYRTEITFLEIRTLDTNSIPGDALLAGAESGTQLTINTGSVQAPAPVLINAAWLDGSIRFDLTTTPGVIYTVQFNADLSNPAGWIPLLTTDAVTTLLSFTNTPTLGANAGFYRALHY